MIYGHDKPQQLINPTCRSLELQGFISRSKRVEDGIIGNYLTGKASLTEQSNRGKIAQHDCYGKRLLKELLGEQWDPDASERSIYEGGVRADLDGLIWSKNGATVECAVEIEARVYKQIRGAIVDLALHGAPRKLLIIMRAQPQLGTEERIKEHCTYIWGELAGKHRGEFQVVCLRGTGDKPAYEEDQRLLAETLRAVMS